MQESLISEAKGKVGLIGCDSCCHLLYHPHFGGVGIIQLELSLKIDHQLNRRFSFLS